MAFKNHRNKERNGTAGILGGKSINLNFSITTIKERKRNTGTENLLARKPYQSEKIINYPRLLLLLSPPPPLLATVCLLHVPWSGEFQDLFSLEEKTYFAILPPRRTTLQRRVNDRPGLCISASTRLFIVKSFFFRERSLAIRKCRREVC